jgi:peptidoglycan hydrolase-like protein with peptidoglycan-binding domain
MPLSRKAKLGLGVAAAVGVTVVAARAMGSTPARPASSDPNVQPWPPPTPATITSANRAGYIARMQRQLAALGYSPGTIDGISGPNTTAAADRFITDTGGQANVDAYAQRAGISDGDIAIMYAIDARYRDDMGLPAQGA